MDGAGCGASTVHGVARWVDAVTASEGLGHGLHALQESALLRVLPTGAQHRRGQQPPRMSRRELEGNEATQRIADDVRPGQPQLIHQAHHIIDHLDPVALGLVRLTAASVAAQVQRDDAKVGPQHLQHGSPAPLQVAVPQSRAPR